MPMSGLQFQLITPAPRIAIWKEKAPLVKRSFLERKASGVGCPPFRQAIQSTTICSRLFARHR